MFFFVKRFFLLILLSLAFGSAAQFGSVQQVRASDAVKLAKSARFPGDVVLIKGGFDVFSDGFDEIAAKLAKKGIDARVSRHTRVQQIANRIIANQKKYGRKPVVLIGHSWGANAVIEIAEILKRKRIRINYAVTFAPTNPKRIPSNIQKLTNYYFKSGGWGKPVRAAKGFRGRLKNIDVSPNSDIGHFNIDENPKLQNQVIRNIQRFVKRRRIG